LPIYASTLTLTESSTLFDEILRWAERTASERFGRKHQIECSTDAGDEQRIEALLRHGYSVDRVFHLMSRSIDGTPAPTEPVTGYRIRAFSLDADIDAWLDLYANAFQDHYDFHPIARDDRMSVAEDEGYMPELDLVAESDSGDLAAFCFTLRRADSAGGVDWHVDLVGTHREHRRRGLAELLLQRTFSIVHARGGTSISLEVDSTSPTGAHRLYERLGFTIARESIDYRKWSD
jgi:mycothiol synthase